MHQFRTCSGWTIAAVIVLFVAGCAATKKEDSSSTGGNVTVSGTITYLDYIIGSFLVGAFNPSDWGTQNAEPFVGAEVAGGTSAEYALSVPADKGSIVVASFNDADGDGELGTDEAGDYAEVTVGSSSVSGVNLTLTVGGLDGNGGDPTGNAFVPTAADGYEPDNTAAQANALAVDGALQRHTLFGPNDDDWFTVSLTQDVTYEFFTTNLNETADTYLYLIDTDGVTYISSSDDYLDYDSHIEYTPTVSGTYHLMVRAYDPPTGIATYSLGARTLVNVDDDFWSAFYDCNDSDNTIYPEATETPGDGIDQDCNGIDQPLGTVADAAESDDSIATAKDMVEAGGSAYEIIYRRDIYEGNGRTLHTVGDVDFFRVVVPAWGQLEVNVVDYDVSLNAIFYDADGIEVGTGGGYYDLTNATSSPATFYVKYSASDGTSTGWYVPYFVNLGTDQDQDTYYTGNWSGSRDCNDGNASIYDGALETESDSIDSNCDGADGTATVTYPESYPPAGPMQPAGALGSHHPAKARR